MADIEDIFELGDMPVVDKSDLMPEDIINIVDIESQATEIAGKLVNKVKKIYFTKSELKNDGYAQTIIDRSIASIALLEKMLLSDEALVNKLVINCCLNSGNNGLFMSLARMQDEIIDIQKQITKELTDLHEELSEIKNADVDDEVETKEPATESKTAFRGGKDFLKSLISDEQEDEDYDN